MNEVGRITRIVGTQEIQPQRDHLFISYATEDGELAEWLALRLVAEGYKVWCDRFKLLGGESYPSDIDRAIKDNTFRVLALLSKSSINKPNPIKERTLALNIGRERNVDFLIPLNVDGLKPTELDWMTNDLSYIPFNESWALGLQKVLKKLDSIGCPKKMSDGRNAVIEAISHSNIITEQAETVVSNCLRIISIPSTLQRYELPKGFSHSDEKVLESWPLYRVNDKFILSLTPPPNEIRDNLKIINKGGALWSSVAKVDGISSKNIIARLLRETLFAKGITKGMVRVPGKNAVMFPSDFGQKGRIRVPKYQGRTRRVNVVGERRGHKYQMALTARAYRDWDQETYLIANIFYEFPNVTKEQLVRHRKRLGHGLFNHQWLIRYLGIFDFLSDEDSIIRYPGGEGDNVEISTVPVTLHLPVHIDEDVLEKETKRLSQESLETL